MRVYSAIKRNLVEDYYRICVWDIINTKRKQDRKFYHWTFSRWPWVEVSLVRINLTTSKTNFNGKPSKKYLI